MGIQHISRWAPYPHHRVLLGGLLALGLALFGCGRQSQGNPPEPSSPTASAMRPVEVIDTSPLHLPQTFGTEQGDVQVLAMRRVDGALEAEVQWQQDGHAVSGTLRLGRGQTRKGWSGLQAHLVAKGGQDFGLLVEWDPATEGREHLREWAAGDHLDLERSLQDDAVLERYDVNGRRLEVAMNASGTVLTPKTADGSVFQRASAVYGNATGDRLVALLTHEQFGPWLGQLDRRGSGGGGCPKWLSGFAQPCSYLKCMFGGGVANPLCHVCTGVSWGCAIADIVCLWADCD